MASSINAVTTGGGGVVTTADSSGILNLQSGGATIVAVASTGVAVTGTLSSSSGITGNITGNVTGSSGSCTGNSATATALSTATGSAPSYSARAWVNFDGTTNNNLSGTYARLAASTTVTVTATAHGQIVGNQVNLDFTSGTALDGIYTVVTVADANTFTVTTAASTATSGNVTLLRSTIRASGNVSSITDNGVGDYTVNFINAMPDANYSLNGAVNGWSAASPSQNSGTFAISMVTLSTTAARIYCMYTNGGGNNTAFTLQDASIITTTIVR